MSQLTDEQKKEAMSRREEFIKGYGELRERCQYDFLSMPAFIPTEKGTFELVLQTDIVDLKQLAVKSNIVVENA